MFSMPFDDRYLVRGSMHLQVSLESCRMMPLPSFNRSLTLTSKKSLSRAVILPELKSTHIHSKSMYVTFQNSYGIFLTVGQSGVPFANAVANVAWKNDKVVSFGSSFVKPCAYLSVFH